MKSVSIIPLMLFAASTLTVSGCDQLLDTLDIASEDKANQNMDDIMDLEIRVSDLESGS